MLVLQEKIPNNFLHILFRIERVLFSSDYNISKNDYLLYSYFINWLGYLFLNEKVFTYHFYLFLSFLIQSNTCPGKREVTTKEKPVFSQYI